MAKDVIARLKADTSQWDSGLAKATRSLNNFQKQNMSLDAALQGSAKALTSVAAKYVGWGAAATGAMKVVKDAFMNNEASLDEWGRVVESTGSIYKGFLNSLNTGDISGYLSNISSIISAAREAYDAMDELATFKAFNQVNSARNKANYSEALDAYRLNPNDKTKKALAEANKAVIKDLKDEADKSNNEYDAALKNLFSQRGLSKEAQEQAKKLFKSGSWSDLQTAKNAGYKEFGWGESLKQGYVGTLDTWKGQRVGQSGSYVATYKNNGNVVDKTLQGQEKVDYELSKFLQGVNDSEIKAVQEIGAKSFALEQAIADQNRSYNRMAGNNAPRNGSHNSKTTKPEEIIPEGSIAEAEKKIKELQDAWRNATTQDDRNNLAEQLKEANAQLDIMTGKVKEVKVPEMTTGFSGVSTGAISAWQSDIMKQMSTTDITSPLFQKLQSDLADTNALSNIIGFAMQKGIDMAQFDVEGLWEKVLNGEDIANMDWQSIIDTINEKLAEIDASITPISLNFNTGNLENVKDSVKGLDKNVNGAATAFTAMGNALNQIEDPGAKVAGYIASAIGQTAAAFGTAQTQAATMGPWAWIAFAAIGLATMISTIAGIKSATAGAKFADGGIVGGSSYVGDKTPIMANAGEVILNYSQQANLAENLEARNTGQQMQPYATGETIYFGLSTYLRQNGMGEMITTNSR